MSNESELVLTVEECSRRIKLSRPTVYREINDGRLRSFQQGRRRLISVNALQEWIAERESESQLPRERRAQK
jgi:excisionase family DNA binding protein